MATEYSNFGSGNININVRNANEINLDKDTISYNSTTLISKNKNEITFTATNGTYRWTTIKKYLEKRNILFTEKV